MDEVSKEGLKKDIYTENESLQDFYANKLNENDIKILKSLNEQTKFIEANFYADNLRKMGFEISSDAIDISLNSEEINSYSKEYIKIEKDGLFGLASLLSSRIYIPCEYEKIEKNSHFKFNAFVLKKGEYIYIYNYDKDVIISKIKAEKIISVMEGNNIIIKDNEKIGIYNILKNTYVLDCEYEDVFYYDDRIIAILKNNVITIYNYINSKVLLEYKFSSNEYYMEGKELSSKNIFVINKENKLGLLNIFTGEFLAVPEYDEVKFVECYGKKNMVILKKENKYGLYSLDKKQFIIQCICDEIKVANEKLRKYIFIYTINGLKGVASCDKVITNYVFNEIIVYNKGLYMVCKTDKNCYVYSNDKCLFTLDNNSKFKMINLESKRCIFKGTRFNDKDIICVDINNRRVIDGDLMYYSIEKVLEDNKGYIIKSYNNHYFILNIENDDIYDNIIKDKHYTNVKKLKKYFVLFRDDKCALADTYGKLITRNRYDDIYENEEGLIIFKMNDYVGYFHDNIVTKCMYNHLVSFSEDNKFILANKEGKNGLLLNGKVIIPFDYEEIFLADENYIDEICNIFNISNIYEKIKYIVRKCGKYAVCSEKGFVMSDFIFLERKSLCKITNMKDAYL